MSITRMEIAVILSGQSAMTIDRRPISIKDKRLISLALFLRGRVFAAGSDLFDAKKVIIE